MSTRRRTYSLLEAMTMGEVLYCGKVGDNSGINSGIEVTFSSTVDNELDAIYAEFMVMSGTETLSGALVFTEWTSSNEYRVYLSGSSNGSTLKLKRSSNGIKFTNLSVTASYLYAIILAIPRTDV